MIILKHFGKQMKFLKYFIFINILILLASCGLFKEKLVVKYNLISPKNNIYEIIKKDVSENEIKNNFFEKTSLLHNKPIKIERCDKNGKLTDELFAPAITTFEYYENGNTKFVKYFNKILKPFSDKNFGFASIEYVYDELNRVRIEIYRDENFKFLKIPYDTTGNVIMADFIAPILVYEYFDFQTRIKAFDQNFNLLKEIVGEKPCIPFIDCGD